MIESTTILVVDDMEINRAILGQLFQEESKILEAENGQEAMALIEVHPEIDVVILDIVMPVMDGFETLAAIRAKSNLSDLPVIICTEHADVDIQVRALDLGSTDFITKPFNARVVRHRVRNLVQLRQMERKIADQRRADQLRSTLNSIVSPLGLFEFTGNDVHALYLNQSYTEMFVQEPQTLQALSNNMLTAIHSDDARELKELLEQNQRDGTPVDLTYRITLQNGVVRMHAMNALSIRYEHYQNPVYLTSIADITDQRRTEVALRDTDQRLKSLINAVPGGIITFDLSGSLKVTYFNDTACDIVSLTRAEFQAKVQEDVFSLVHPEDMPIIHHLIRDFVSSPRVVGKTFRIVRKDGEIRWLRLSASPITTGEGALLANCVCTDVSIEKESELKLEQAFKEMQYRSEHDRLTGIWNRETFNQKTHDVLLERADVSHVVLAMNIQRFKMINELFGAKVGDEVLCSIGRGLEQLFSHIGTYGRMEADHFMACFPLSELNMEHIMTLLDSHLRSQHIEYHIEISFGIYQVHNIHVPVEQMCDRATMALKTIKGSAVKRYAFYDENMRKNLLEEQSIIEEMNDALQQGQFVPYLQPIYSLATLRPVSAEVLVRWKHPTKGMISPGTFVPLFESNGFITKLDFAVWEQACQLLSKWKKEELPVVPLSINISRIDLYQPHLCEYLLSLLKKYDLDPSLLKLEITESAYIDDPDVLTAVIQRLRDAGFRILMDDFGSGYSSLNTLKDMPINVIKIDMRFLAELEESPRAASILTSVVRMAKWLDMPVIAEGVETKAQLDFLYSIGCDEVQGYYFSRPLPSEDFKKLLTMEPQKEDAQLHTQNAVENLDIDFFWGDSMDANLLFSSMIGGMALYEMIGDSLEVRRVNDAYYSVLGRTPQQVFREVHNTLDNVYPDDRSVVLDACARSIQTNRVEIIVIRAHHGDGHMLWVEVKLRHLSSEGEHPLFLFIINDITRQKEFEITHNLSNYTQFLRAIYERIYELNFTTNQFIEVFRADGQPIGAPCTISEGSKRLAEYMHPDDMDSHHKSFDSNFLNEQIQASPIGRSYMLQQRRKDGKGDYYWFTRTYVKMDRSDGQDVYLLCLGDINRIESGK